MKFITRDMTDKTNRKFFVDEIPEKYQAEAEKRREQLLDAVSVASDEITELILEGKEVPEDLIRKALRKGTLEGLFTPVHCGSAKMFHGVQQLLDLVVDCLPSPLDRPPVEGIHPKTKDVVVRKPDPKEPLSALAFKTVAESDRRPGVHPRLLRRAEAGRDVPEHDQRQDGADRPVLPDDGRQAAGAGEGRPRRHRRRHRPEADVHRATRCATRTHPVALESITLPEAGDRRRR